MPTKIKKAEFAGVGAGLQLLGVVLCFVLFPFGLVGGIMLLVYGGMRANVWRCSECRGNVDQAANVCRHCRAEFK